MHRSFSRVLATLSISAVAVICISGAASALPIKDVLGEAPGGVIIDPPPPTTVPPVTLPPYTVPPTTPPTTVAPTPPTTTATPPPNSGGNGGNGGSNTTPSNNSENNGVSVDDQANASLDSASTSLPPLGVDTLAAAPVASETERSSSGLILVGAVLAAALASLGAGLFLRQHRRRA